MWTHPLINKHQRRNQMSDTPKLQHAADGGCPPATCSPAFPKMPIDAALEFADSGESTGGIMTHEALETLAAAYRDVLRILKDPVAVHINMLRGTIAWTPEHLRHVLGDSQENEK
jgi:hypothetical protein